MSKSDIKIVVHTVILSSCVWVNIIHFNYGVDGINLSTLTSAVGIVIIILYLITLMIYLFVE